MKIIVFLAVLSTVPAMAQEAALPNMHTAPDGYMYYSAPAPHADDMQNRWDNYNNTPYNSSYGSATMSLEDARNRWDNYNDTPYNPYGYYPTRGYNPTPYGPEYIDR